MLPFILVVCLGMVFCLTPLAFYFIWLAILNRRDRPTVVSGRWDYAALVGGLSGFILFGGGLLLALLQSNVRFLLRGNLKSVSEAYAQEHLAWSLTVAAYLVFVVGGCLLTLSARRRTLVVYNVDPALFEGTLAEVFEHLGRAVERRGNVWASGVPLLELEPFAAGHTITLRWLSDDPQLFREVERQLREAVTALPGGDLPAARLFTSAAAGCAVLVTFSTVLLVYGLALVRV